MDLHSVEIDLDTETPTAVLHGEDARELGVHPMDRVQLRHNGGTTIGVVKVTSKLVDPGTIGLTQPLNHLTGAVTIRPAPHPESVRYIRRKLDAVELDRTELRTIVQDIYHDRLTDVELAGYVIGVYTNGLSLEETTHLTGAMTNIGERIDWGEPVVADKHSIGGVPGNRTTPIVVSIVAAAGLTIPKTSSKAITSPAGTADMMATLCDVALDRDRIESVVRKTNGCLAWGGAMDLSPVDDRIIQVETPLSLDPPGQVIASVLSKKRSAGATHVVIDIPYGEGAKVSSLPAARRLARDFQRVGDHLGISVACAITRGTGPIGRGIGPALEARDVLAVLDGDGPPALRSKSVQLADILLEACGSDADSMTLLESGRARETFGEIIEAQNGDPTVTASDIDVGKERHTVTAGQSGTIMHVDISLISSLARRAGAPRNPGAGLWLHRARGDAVSNGEKLVTIHAESAAKLEDAVRFYRRHDVFRISGEDNLLIEEV